MRLRELFEAPATAVMAFGRMNPPTIGHAKLVDAIKSQPGDPFIFLSQTQKPKTDPLSFQDKLRYAKFFFPEVTIGNPEVKTIIQALQKVEALGYQQLIYVAGSDRVQAFDELLNKYNGKDFTFKSIKVVSAGERDADAEGAEGMSASKLKKLAAEGKLEDWTDETGKKQPGFRSGVPKPEVADEMFAAVRQGMGVKDTVAAEDASSDEEDKFHKKLDKLVHKTFGHSSDEKKKKKDVDEAEVTPEMPKKIKPIKMSNPPKAPDATIPRTRDGYTTDDGTVYKQDKYNENLMHVSNGGGTYTFDGSRLIRWKTPKINGYSQIHDFIKNTITVDANTSVTTKNPDFGQKPADAEILKKNGIDLSTSTTVVDTNAVYDLKGNLIDKGEVGVRTGGLGVSAGADKLKINYVISDNLSIHIAGSSKGAVGISPEQIKAVKAKAKQAMNGALPQPLIALATETRKLGAKVTFKSPANQGAIPFNQGIQMLKKASG